MACLPEQTPRNTDFSAVAAILRKLCKAPLADLAPDTCLDELPDMDSLRVLQVVALLEEQFGVEIDAASVDRMSSLGDVLHALDTAKRGHGPAGGGT